jgi:hypothetical protein
MPLAACGRGRVAQRAAAWEPQGFAAFGLGVPRRVVAQDGHRATVWSPEGITDSAPEGPDRQPAPEEN